MPGAITWSGGMTGNFRALPEVTANQPNGNITDQAIRVFLSSDGRTEQQVLQNFPYDAERAQRQNGAAMAPDPKRYRDVRQLVRAVGLAYDEDMGNTKVVRVTPLGEAFMRWDRDGLNQENVRVIARYAARAMSAAQLRNPTKEGRQYAHEVNVFPFTFIWRAMLALEGRITREELNRGLYNTKDEDELQAVIERIRLARVTGDVDSIGPRAIERGQDGNLTARRVRGWMAWASFGWTLIDDEAHPDQGFTITKPWAREVLEQVAAARRKHRHFKSVPEYLEHLSAYAGLPADLRLRS